jgi:hypothetical protein
MAKSPTLTTILSGFYSAQALNGNFEDIADAFENTLSLDGSSPNSMEADLDMDGNAILNAVIELTAYTVAGLPTAVGATGQVVYVSNGDAGSPCLGVSNGTSWLRVALGAAVSAS